MTPEAVTEDPMGPVDLLVIGFPDGRPHGSGFQMLAEMVESGAVRILDFEFVRRDPDGTQVVELADLPDAEGFDSQYWSGSSSHLLDSDDLDELAADLHVGELAVVLLIEQQWLIGLTRTWVDDGARIIAEGGVPTQDLLDALDSAERKETN